MQTVRTDHEIELALRRTFKSYGHAIRCVLDFRNAVAEDNFTSAFDCAVNYFSETAARQTDVASTGHFAENIDAKSSDASPATINEAHLLHSIGAMVQVAIESLEVKVQWLGKYPSLIRTGGQATWQAVAEANQ